jgi:hypothetical protein
MLLSFFRIFLLGILIGPGLVLAQAPDNYTPIGLDDLGGFEAPGSTWKLYRSVEMKPSSAKSLATSAGSGVLLGSAGQPLRTKATMQDLRLRFEFMLSPGAQAYITLPGGPKVLLAEEAPVGAPGATTSGYVGQFPLQNAAKVAGLWQTFELAYDASTPNQDAMARLNLLMLNGVTVQQGVYLPLSKAVAQGAPLELQITRGMMAIRNLGYQALANRKPLAVENLSYKLYTDAWDTPTPAKLEREAKTTDITQELGNGLREFHLAFEGDMQVSEDGNYIFTIAHSGPRAELMVDGKPVLTVGESTSQDLHQGNIALTKGKHAFKLRYSRFPWRRPALGLSVFKAGVRPYDLTSLSSLPVPEPKPYLSVSPEARPEMVRSFVFYNGEKQKRTHVVSVGGPTGWHYTMDLNRGALLQGWRGQFADVTEMWYERGEPQLLATAGLTVPVSGQSSYAQLDNPNAVWPDSANLNYLGYRLDASGTPAMRYAFGNATLTDRLTSAEEGLVRTLSVEGSAASPLYALLGAGKEIKLVEKGLYRIDDRYYVRVDTRAKAVQRSSNGRQELLLPVNGTATYTIFW